MAIAYQHVREAPRPPSEAQPGLPKEIDAIVLKALNKNPLNRYQTAAEMRSDLVRALSGQAVQATPLMSDDERTELMRAAPTRVGAAWIAAAAGSAGAAGPRRGLGTGGRRPVQAGVGLRRHRRAVPGAAGRAIWLTLRVISAPPPPALVAVPDLSGMSLRKRPPPNCGTAG